MIPATIRGHHNAGDVLRLDTPDVSIPGTYRLEKRGDLADMKDETPVFSWGVSLWGDERTDISENRQARYYIGRTDRMLGRPKLSDDPDYSRGYEMAAT